MHRAIAFVDESLVPQFFEHPPDGLHKISVHRFVRMLHIRPSPDATNHLFPFIHILKYGRSAEVIELLNTHRLDIFFARDAERLLGDVFNRKPMAVPPPFPFHLKPAHRPIPRHHVLHHARDDMPIVRRPRRKGRPVIKTVSFGSLATGNRPLKNFLPIPQLQNRLLHLWRIHFGINFFKHRDCIKNKKSSTQNMRQGRPDARDVVPPCFSRLVAGAKSRDFISLLRARPSGSTGSMENH